MAPAWNQADLDDIAAQEQIFERELKKLELEGKLHDLKVKRQKLEKLKEPVELDDDGDVVKREQVEDADQVKREGGEQAQEQAAHHFSASNQNPGFNYAQQPPPANVSYQHFIGGLPMPNYDGCQLRPNNQGPHQHPNQQWPTENFPDYNAPINAAGQGAPLATPESTVPQEPTFPGRSTTASPPRSQERAIHFVAQPAAQPGQDYMHGYAEAPGDQAQPDENEESDTLALANHKYKAHPRYTSLIRKPNKTGYWELRCHKCHGNTPRTDKDKYFNRVGGLRAHISTCHPDELDADGKISTQDIITKCRVHELSNEEVMDMDDNTKGSYQILKTIGAAAHANAASRRPHPWKMSGAGGSIKVEKKKSTPKKPARKKQKRSGNANGYDDDPTGDYVLSAFEGEVQDDGDAEDDDDYQPPRRMPGYRRFRSKK